MLLRIRTWVAATVIWLRNTAWRAGGPVVRPVVRFVREMYETQVWFDEETDTELRRVMAERPHPPRRRSFLRSRRLQAAVAAGGRLAALLGLLFPVAFAVGWLFQAGQLLGYGVPLSLVTPDPVQLAVSAATFTVLLSAVFGLMLGVWGAYARIGPRWRARIYMVQLPVSLVLGVLLLLGFDFGLDVELLLFLYFVFVLQPLLMASSYRRIFTWRALGQVALVVLLLAPGPLGWLTAASERASADTPGDLTVTVDGELPGISGHRVRGDCAHEDMRLLHLDPTRAVLHRPGSSTVWVVPTDNILSIAIDAPPMEGPAC